MVDYIRVDSQTLGHLEHYGQRDELYSNHMPVSSRMLLYNLSTYLDVESHC